MSSLKDAAAVLQADSPPERAQNKYAMSVTPDVSHVEMWPYAASAAVAVREPSIDGRSNAVIVQRDASHGF